MLLSIASSAGPMKYDKLRFSEMTPFLDFYNLMAYDFTGIFSTVTGYTANLYPSVRTPSATPFSADAAIKYYVEAGVPPDKINLMMPLYGRDFHDTSGMGQPFHGVGKGSWEPGVWDYKALPQPGTKILSDNAAVAEYTWDTTRKVIVSFDTVVVSNKKIQYIKDHGLGGAGFWELSGDKSGNQSLVINVRFVLLHFLNVLD